MKPHLVRWHKDYADKGLVVIDVNDGSIDTFEALKDSLAKSEVKFPVLWDKDARNVSTYKVEGMPAAYLVGVEGTVVWEGHPNAAKAEADKLEARIKEELARVKK
jgi:hypothetical protein